MAELLTIVLSCVTDLDMVLISIVQFFRSNFFSWFWVLWCKPNLSFGFDSGQAFLFIISLLNLVLVLCVLYRFLSLCSVSFSLNLGFGSYLNFDFRFLIILIFGFGNDSGPVFLALGLVWGLALVFDFVLVMDLILIMPSFWYLFRA